MRRCAANAGLLLLGLLCAHGVHAQARLPLELEWQAPAECPSASAVRTELERIARVRPGYGLQPLAAHAQVERRGATYATTLHTEHEGQAGERALEAADCDTLVHSVTLVLALAFGAGVEVADTSIPAQPAQASDAEAEQRRAAQSAAAAATRAQASPEPEQVDVAADGAEPRAGNRARVQRWSLLAGGGAQLALLPATALVASAGAELALGAFSIGLRANAWPGVTDTVAAQLDARFDGLGGALQGCGRLPWAPLVLALCAEARASALRGRSSGATSGSAVAPWYALAGAASLTWPDARVLSVRVQAALAASLDRPRFVIDALAQVHRVPALVPDFAAFLIVTP